MSIHQHTKLGYVLEAVQHRLSQSETSGEQTRALEEWRDETQGQRSRMSPPPTTAPAIDLNAAQAELETAKANANAASDSLAAAERKVQAAVLLSDIKRDEDKRSARGAYRGTAGPAGPAGFSGDPAKSGPSSGPSAGGYPAYESD